MGYAVFHGTVTVVGSQEELGQGMQDGDSAPPEAYQYEVADACLCRAPQSPLASRDQNPTFNRVPIRVITKTPLNLPCRSKNYRP